MRGASLLLCVFALTSSARAGTLRLVCGAPVADTHGVAHIVAAAVDERGLVPARGVKVENGSGARPAVDAFGRVDLSGFADAARITLRIKTARGVARGQCQDSAPQRALAFEQVPPEARAGKGQLRLRLAGAYAPLAELRANVGEVTTRPAGQGLVVLYTPPPERTPDLAIIEATAVVEGRRFRARASVPLVASVKLPGQSEPRSEVTVEVAGRRFGPVKADGRGRFQVRVELPPGVTSAHGESVDEIGNRGEQEIEIPVPPVHRLGALEVTPTRWRGQPLLARLFVFSPRGTPASGERIAFGIAGGEVETAAEVAPGLYQAMLPPPTSGAEQQARVVALIDDDPVAEVVVTRASRPPVSIAVTPSAGKQWALRGGSGERVVAQAVALDALGAPVSGVLLAAAVDGEPAVIAGDGPRHDIVAGPPAPALFQRAISVTAVQRRPPCAADHLRIVSTPQAEARAVDASGLACPQSPIAVDGDQTYGAAALLLPARRLHGVVQVRRGDEAVHPVVLVRGAAGVLPLAIDVDATVASVLKGKLSLPVAPAPVEVRAQVAADGSVEVSAVDAMGATATGRELKVWPPDGCTRLESSGEGRWRCEAPRARVLVFTDPSSGASLMVPLDAPVDGQQP